MKGNAAPVHKAARRVCPATAKAVVAAQAMLLPAAADHPPATKTRALRTRPEPASTRVRATRVKKPAQRSYSVQRSLASFAAYVR
jgi:hypothetical protein